ncbi:lysophospholipid acyltransferase family protein [Paracoccus sp. NBH48]|uniref:lysophospholipid acyltransferase family protein n=1 Tax=Paracoccus sp. NBH48 TaxID=2596918 RepID=UPI00210537B9|nr:lysophospholipid acyltransferase family protein [Paracoccus sp. NBH48]
MLGVLLILPLRGIERLVHGRRRPWTGPHVQIVCRLVLACIGLSWRREGTPLRGPGAVVANHSSWLDILTLNAALPVFFVSKAEVARWPGINVLTRVTDTHFVTRDPKLARAQALEFAERIRAGHRLLFFPEGTSSDGRRVLPFKPTLFQGFLADDLPAGLAIQPVSAVYHAPPGQDPRFYGWWADMDLGPHLLSILAARRHGHVTVRLHPPDSRRRKRPQDPFGSMLFCDRSRFSRSCHTGLKPTGRPLSRPCQPRSDAISGVQP